MPTPRYEVLDTIARGDFAVVYRARDRELGREVAIKQIHAQYLADQQQLARYWKEAQLLATLQHPHVLTIYDIVRSRGWLILEYMRSSLQKATQGDGIDLDFLKSALAGILSALQFLHANGVIHGDIKPSNLLVDAQGRVKLGDFGLARRASNEEGSLLKGTTKYMAPELIASQFGPVGPASDLYSLGFTAYELICGRQFESLFPGLGTFGRDRQIAWMMWHAAPDRQLPPILRVLEGVPKELAQVIDRMVIKDPARRYHSAVEALKDLRVDPLSAPPLPEQVDAEAEAAKTAGAKKKKRMRIAAIGALACSVILSVFLLLPKQKPSVPNGPPAPERAVVTQVYPGEWRLAVASGEAGTAKEIELSRHDKIFINDKSKLLRDLRPKDEIQIKIVKDESSGRRLKEIYAYRPKADRGVVKTVEAKQGQFTFTLTEGEDKDKEMTIAAPPELKITFNGRSRCDGKTVQLGDLQPGDRLEVHHIGRETGREATKLAVQRVVTLKGVLRDLDAKKGRFTVASGPAESPRLRTLPFAPECEITLNRERFFHQRVLKPGDLQPGDKVTVAHDVQALRVHAYRVIDEAGILKKALYGARTLDVQLEGQDAVKTFFVGKKCPITLEGQPASLGDLRDGDLLEITHDDPQSLHPAPMAIRARRPPDPQRWAILIATQNYDDPLLTKLASPLADAALLKERLVKRYRVPADQAVLLADESLVRLERTIPDRLGRLDPASKLIVCVFGHAYQDEKGTIYLAPKNFDLKRIDTTGLALQWLVDELESCPAQEKLLLLDCTHAGDGPDLAQQPSTADMMRTLTPPPGRALLRTVHAITGTQSGQRGLLWEEKGHGLFPYLLAEAYAGAADKNRDTRLEPTELFEYLKKEMAVASKKLPAKQSPELFLADDRPPRFSADAKSAIRRLAAYLQQKRPELDRVAAQYQTAQKAAGKQPEPPLLYGMLLLKAKHREEALQLFEEIKLEYPHMPLPRQGIAWMRLDRHFCADGITELTTLMKNLAPRTPGKPLSTEVRPIFYWTGQLREYAAEVAPENRRPSEDVLQALDNAVADLGPEGKRLYEQGRAKTRTVAADFEKRIATADSPADASKWKIERRRLVHYTHFPFNAAVQEIISGLDR